MKSIKYIAIFFSAALFVTGCDTALAPGISGDPATVVPEKEVSFDYSDLPGESSFFSPGSEQDLINETHYGYLIVRIEDSFKEKVITDAGAVVVNRMEMNGGRYLYVRKNREVLKLLKTLNNAPGVVYAEPDMINEMYSAVTYSDDLNDPRINSSQYSYHITGLGEALKTYGVGEYDVFIATIDSGINKTHEEFGSVYGAHPGYSMFDKTGDAGSVSYTFVGPGNDPVAMDGSNWDSNPGEGHGTHVSGTILAEGNNGLGVTGVCPDNATYLFYKCFADDENGNSVDGSGSTWAVYGSFKHLVDYKVANIDSDYTVPVNMSLGGDYASYYAIDVINYGLENKVVAVVASGNDGFNISAFPAAYQGVIAVGATNGRDEKVHFSNSGKHLSVSAPGFNIISAGNTAVDEYVYMSGTSMATPFVTGLVGLMLTHDPTLSPAMIKHILESTADDKGAPGFDEDYGWGRVNVAAAIEAVINLSPSDSSPYSEYLLQANVTNSGIGVAAVPVYLYKSTGEFVASSLSSESGIASFGLLREGDYILKTFYFGESLSDDSDPVKVVSFNNPLGNVVVDFAYDFPIYNIITATNEGTAGTDTVIELYRVDDSDPANPAFEFILDYDRGALDQTQYPLQRGEDYVIGITAYVSDGSPLDGHYAIRISEDNPDPSSYTGSAALTDGNDDMEPNDTEADAYVINPEQTYNAYLDGEEYDFYRISIPAN
ncbi:S8 family peptidase [Spirochaeta isovalerica]|uniref:Thermitase n=1 Tax=Spirochaeta isovalerica TaxID=150 RepID=A0A841R9D4_9SPIO|nr:S8 family serine peptidase [Spirochaeta isovalerica]MBB6479817.1 thermitase [Spirochaeta isovalerica]